MGDRIQQIKNLPDIQAILELGPAVVYHCNEYWEYGINYISPNITQMLGWLPDDFLNDAEFRQKLIHQDDLHSLLIDVSALYEKGHQKHEYRLCHKNGHYVWVLDEVRCLYDDDGKVTGIVGYLSDITQSKNKDRYLKESEMRYRAIFETVLEGIITIDEQGIIQDMNRVSERIFGYDRTELIGRNVSMLMPSPDADKHDEYIRKYMLGGDAKIIGRGRDVKGLRKNGDVFDMHLSVSELNLPTGKNFVGCVRDISKRILAENKLKTSQERLRKSQQFAKIGSWDWQLETDELYWSDQVAPLLGLDDLKGELRKERLGEWVHPDDRDQVKTAIRACLEKGHEYNSIHRVLWPDGTVHWVHEQGNTVRDDQNRAVRMVGVIQDVSEAKRREEELDYARKQADEANKAKSEFLSRMSHELRTPLNAILGFAQLLGFSRKHPLSDRQAQQVTQIVAAGQHLLELINEILDLAKIEAGRLSLSLEAVPLKPVVDECLDFCQTMALEKNIIIQVPQSMDYRVYADRTRLKQVILNLLTNAIKYNNENGHVWLDIKAIETGRLRISLKDDGLGIDAQFQDQMFKPFNRLGAETTQIEGTGIGLTLTKQLVELMNGTIDFESELGEGTHFWVDFDSSDIHDHAVEKMFAPKLALAERKTILYIEDNPENIELMVQIINMVDYLSLVTRQNPLEALAEVQEINPDLIMVDYNLEEINGLELVERLQALEGYVTPPIIVLSASNEVKIKQKADDVGIYEYFMKPLNITAFLEKMSSLWSEKK